VIHQAPDAAVRAGAEVTEERQQHSARGEDALRGTVSTGFGNPPCHPVRRWVSAGGRIFCEGPIKLDDRDLVLKLAMQGFIPRSGNALQPNVAAWRLRWEEEEEDTTPMGPIGVEAR